MLLHSRPSSTALLIRSRPLRLIATFLLLAGVWSTTANGQETPAERPASPDAEVVEAAAETPKTVEVAPTADDAEIARRLTGILTATEWFESPTVRVEDGVAFLTGVARDEAAKTRAGEISRSTESVVAVVNKMTVRKPDIWDFSPATDEVRELGRRTIQYLPLLGIAAFVLLIAWLLAKLTRRLSRPTFRRRTESRLLADVLANLVALPVLVAGIYIAMRISGLTQLAATVVGGTGLLGLVVGIAFRDIAENFLASILISVNRPFAVEDLVEIDGNVGLVQAVTTRGTLLMTLDGNHVQIPNSVVYKATVTNRSANPNIRQQFTLGIDYEDSIADAQETALATLQASEFILEEPPPMVIVDQLGPSTVNLRVIYWVDAKKHSVLKVQSRTIREVYATLAAAGFHFPDDNRETIVPKPVTIRLERPGQITEEAEVDSSAVIDASGGPQKDAGDQRRAVLSEPKRTAAGEEDMSSETAELQKQADSSRTPAAGENLLDESNN